MKLSLIHKKILAIIVCAIIFLSLQIIIFDFTLGGLIGIIIGCSIMCLIIYSRYKYPLKKE